MGGRTCTEPCFAGVRRRRRGRTPVGSRRTVAVSESSFDENTERRAARITGVLLLALTAYVVAISALTLLGCSEPRPSCAGIAILTLAAAIMAGPREAAFVLGHRQRRTTRGRSGIVVVRTPFHHCAGRGGNARVVRRDPGGSRRRFDHYAFHRVGGTRGPARQGWWLLKSRRL
jgi:hypothetical protein